MLYPYLLQYLDTKSYENEESKINYDINFIRSS